MTVNEAIAFVMQDLNMQRDRAEQLVLTVDANGDGLVSSVELIELRDKIKEMYVYTYVFQLMHLTQFITIFTLA